MPMEPETTPKISICEHCIGMIEPDKPRIVHMVWLYSPAGLTEIVEEFHPMCVLPWAEAQLLEGRDWVN